MRTPDIFKNGQRDGVVVVSTKIQSASVSTKSERDAAESWFGVQIKNAIKHKNKSKTQLLIQAFKVLFPHQPISPDLYIFEAYWEIKQYRKAIQIYRRMGCPFWYSRQVGSYFESNGQPKLAIREYERLVKEYYKMRILPLPRGPVELFKLGRWYANKNPQKAIKYLTTYLRAGTQETGGTNFVRYKRQAERLLKLCKNLKKS